MLTPERRSQTRLLDSELVMLCWEQQGTTLKQLCNVNDLTGDGVGLLCDQLVPIGTLVTISYGQGELTGIVRHTSSDLNGDFVGVEFVGISKDSILHFQPELLINS